MNEFVNFTFHLSRLVLKMIWKWIQPQIIQLHLSNFAEPSRLWTSLGTSLAQWVSRHHVPHGCRVAAWVWVWSMALCCMSHPFFSSFLPVCLHCVYEVKAKKCPWILWFKISLKLFLMSVIHLYGFPVFNYHTKRIFKSWIFSSSRVVSSPFLFTPTVL